MRPISPFALLSLAGIIALAVPTVDMEISETIASFEVGDRLGHRARGGIDPGAHGLGKQRLEKRSGYLARCPEFVLNGVPFEFFMSSCAWTETISTFTCYMKAVDPPTDFGRPIMETVTRSCNPGYVCVNGQVQLLQQASQAWCHTKSFSQPLDLPNPTNLRIRTKYAGATQGNTTATILLADPTGSNGMNISMIDIQPMYDTAIGRYPFGSNTMCTDADGCSLFNIPPGTTELQTTLTVTTALAAAMMLVVTG